MTVNPPIRRALSSLTQLTKRQRGIVPLCVRGIVPLCVRGIKSVGFQDLDSRKGDRQRVVILGSGWAGYGLSRQLSPSKYQTLVISPRSYFVFTPLLASTAVGTLEFRTALEPIRSRQRSNVEFVQGWAKDVDFARKILKVEPSVVDEKKAIGIAEDSHGIITMEGEGEVKTVKSTKGKRWEISYDKLVVSVGCYSNTFGTKGVKANAYFLKDVGDARKIRKRILECFEAASLPTTSEKMKQQLLRFAIVGGGPTGMEFAAELNDLVSEDLVKLYPNLTPLVDITVYDVATTVLSMFDSKLGKYAMDTFCRDGINIKTSHHVQELRQGLPRPNGGTADNLADSLGCYTLTTAEDGEVGVGFCVWSTGNMMNPFVKEVTEKSYCFPKDSAEIVAIKEKAHQEEWMIEKDPKTGAIVVDDRLRIQFLTKPLSKPQEFNLAASPRSRAIMKDVFALGDNATLSHTILPATAQTANQQALWLGKRLNNGDIATKTFNFKNLGMMAYLGNWKALLQTGDHATITGRSAWLAWRGAYMTMSVSWRNKILIPTYWFLNWAFGRDITRF